VRRREEAERGGYGMSDRLIRLFTYPEMGAVWKTIREVDRHHMQEE